MSRRKTQEEYENELREKLPHILVRGQYVTNRVKIEHYCLKHNVLWEVNPFNLLQHGVGCPMCQQEAYEAAIDRRRKTDEQFRQEVAALNTGIIPLGVYQGTHAHMDFQCKEDHIWSSTPHDILNGYGCPYCSGNAVLKGYNDLWTTHPEVARLLYDSTVGYEISKGSHRKVEWVCPNCGTHKFTTAKQLIRYGFGCNKCSNTISYPNRFITSLIAQCDVEEMYPEWSPDWIGKCRYDMYFVHNNQPYIVEMDGGIGHGGIQFGTNQPDVDGLMRDKIKDEQAHLHNIPLIRIDCNYETNDLQHRFEYIKNSIINSELKDILPLHNVDWDLCNQDATKSLHMEAAKQYDSGNSIREIAQDLNVSYDAVYHWLKRMAAEGLCSYKPVRGYCGSQRKHETGGGEIERNNNTTKGNLAS